MNCASEHAYMKKAIHLILLGAALLCVSCSGQKEPTQEPISPNGTPLKPNKEGKKASNPGDKGGKPESTTAEQPAISKYAYSGPRMPGLKVSHVSVPGNYVALTFDDGPHPSLTPRVLDILNRHGAKATFFVVGRSVGKNSSILARAVAEGHEIGAHTWSHIKMTSSGSERVINEMDRTKAAIQAATGHAPKVMRPPYGAVNSGIVSLMKSRYGMSTIMWDVDTRDWQHPGVSVVIQRAVGRATPGSIILLHDIHESTLHAVEGIVSGLQARGFRLVTVSQLLALGRHAAQQAAGPQSQPAESNQQQAPVPEAPIMPNPEPAAAAPQAETAATEATPAPQPTAAESAPAQSAETAGAASISGAASNE